VTVRNDPLEPLLLRYSAPSSRTEPGLLGNKEDRIFAQRGVAGDFGWAKTDQFGGAGGSLLTWTAHWHALPCSIFARLRP
jgi:hypothetical protein